ncbi:MAG: hypothetical protein LBK83_07745 [Treponema sp.]|jgi:predicted Holliday junction resolvase-like endonuclease|nr:hypothetical protein [Treponema sp.]
MITLYIVLILLLLCGILAALVIRQSKLIKQATAEAQAALETVRQTRETVVRVQAVLGKQAEAEVKAHEERKELAGTADGDLLHRSNNLFGGVQDRKSGNGGSH